MSAQPLPAVGPAAPVTPIATPSPSAANSAFHTHMEAAEKIFSHLETATVAEKEQMHAELDLAYGAVSKITKASHKNELPATITGQQFARLLFLEGFLQNLDRSPLTASHFFTASIIFQIVDNHTKDFSSRLVHLFDSNVTELMPNEFRTDLVSCSGLKELKTVLSTRHASGTMPKLKEWLAKTKVGDVPFKGSDALQESLRAGICLRWLGSCERTLNTADVIKRGMAQYKAIYGHAEAFLNETAAKGSTELSQQAHLELATLCNSMALFIEIIEHPNDSKGQIKCFYKILDLLKKAGDSPQAQYLEAHVLSTLMGLEADHRSKEPGMEEEYLKVTKTCFDHASKACSIIERNPKLNILSACLCFERAAEFALDSLERGREIAKPEDIQQWISKAKSLLKPHERYSKVQLFIYEARLAACKNDKDNALAFIQQAEQVHTKEYGNTKDEIFTERVNAIKQKIAPKDQPKASSDIPATPKDIPATPKDVPTTPKDTPASPKGLIAAASNLAATHQVTNKVTRDWKEFVVAILIVTVVSAVFIAIGVAVAAPLLIASGTVSALTGGLLLYRWHFHKDQGLNSSTHNPFAAAYPTALAVSAIGLTIFSIIPGAIFGVLGLLIAGGAIYKGETAPVAIRV